MHKAQQILEAIEAALPGSLISPGWKPDTSATVLSMAELAPEGEPSPNTFNLAIWRLTVGVDIYVYELETAWFDQLFVQLSNAHRAIMNPATYAGLPWVQSPWLGSTGEPDIDTSTERSHAYMRAEFFVDFRSDPTDPEN